MQERVPTRTKAEALHDMSVTPLKCPAVSTSDRTERCRHKGLKAISNIKDTVQISYHCGEVMSFKTSLPASVLTGCFDQTKTFTLLSGNS